MCAEVRGSGGGRGKHLGGWSQEERGGFGLRGLLMSANVRNEAMDRQQVARAQHRLDVDYAGEGVRASLIYDAFSRPAQPAAWAGATDAEGSSGGEGEAITVCMVQATRPGRQRRRPQREPDPELDEAFAPKRCSCCCGCRAELEEGDRRRCEDCRLAGTRHQRLLLQQPSTAAMEAAYVEQDRRPLVASTQESTANRWLTRSRGSRSRSYGRGHRQDSKRERSQSRKRARKQAPRRSRSRSARKGTDPRGGPRHRSASSTPGRRSRNWA